MNVCLNSYSEGYFQVLASPHVHAGVVLADIVEILAIYCEQSARHRRRLYWPHKVIVI